jgi:hypothetical protein
VLRAKEETVLQGMIDRLIGIGRCFRMEMNVERTKVVRIWREPFTVRIIVDHKQLENVEYFDSLGNTITNDARCTRDIKFRTDMAKVAFNRKTFFSSKLKLNLSKKLDELPHLEQSCLWRWNLDTSESRSDVPVKFWNVVLQKDGEDH